MARSKIGALWLKEGANGKYFSGVIEDLRGDVPIVIFKNDRKEQDNHPDYIILRSEPMERPTHTEKAEEIDSPF